MQNPEEIEKAINAVNNDAVEKKKPGRPKKKVPMNPVELHGIVDAPVNPEDIMELVYCNPNMFKKLFQLYKQYEVSEIDMNFDKAGLKIETKDHLGKSNIYAIIDGRCMNLFYCKEALKICVKRDSLEKVFGTLNKNNYKITFVLKEDNYRSTMYLSVKDLEYNNDDAYEIDVVFKPDDPNAIRAKDDDTNYPIKFQMSSKHFKNRINNIKKLSPVFTIQKVGDGPLQLTFDKAQKVNLTSVYNDSEKIGLESKLDPDDVFSVSVHIDYIKPFSNSNIGDDVFIAADKRERMSFMTRLDKKDIGFACIVRIFTTINNYRGRPDNA